jgi:hypothetical protein
MLVEHCQLRGNVVPDPLPKGSGAPERSKPDLHERRHRRVPLGRCASNFEAAGARNSRIRSSAVISLVASRPGDRARNRSVSIHLSRLMIGPPMCGVRALYTFKNVFAKIAHPSASAVDPRTKVWAFQFHNFLAKGVCPTEARRILESGWHRGASRKHALTASKHRCNGHFSLLVDSRCGIDSEPANDSHR